MENKEVKPHGPKSKHEAPKGSLAWKIRKKRRELGISAPRLAEEVGMTDAAITKIETGQTNLNSERSKWSLFKIAKRLNDHFDEDWLKPYIQANEAEGQIILSPELTDNLKNIVAQLNSSVPLDELVNRLIKWALEEWVKQHAQKTSQAGQL